MKELKLKVEGMVCEGCENRVKSAISLMDGVENVDANHNTGIVTVNVKEDLDIAKIKEKIESKYQKNETNLSKLLDLKEKEQKEKIEDLGYDVIE